MEPERRRAKRKSPGELTYIEFGTQSGGMVWNASEEGLGFYAVAPVQDSGPLRLCISPHPDNRIELLGAVVWMDKSKRLGGLQLKDLGPETLQSLRDWLTRPTVHETRGTKDEAVTLPRQTVEQNADIPTGAEDKLPKLLLDSGPSHSARSVITPVRSNAIGQLSTQLQRTIPRPFPEQKQRAMRPRGGHTVWAALLICEFLFAVTLVSDYFRPELGNAFIRLGERLKGTSEVGIAVSPSPQVGGVNQHSSGVSMRGPGSLESPMATEAGETAPAGFGQTTRDTWPAESPPAAEKSRGAHFPGNTKTTVQGLWRAVGEGDVAAEVALAQQYLNGTGVTKNCEQARILLRAASRTGNTEAMRELNSWKVINCR